jgi:hypothetical protein
MKDWGEETDKMREKESELKMKASERKIGF